jgi:hypothetical protein
MAMPYQQVLWSIDRGVAVAATSFFLTLCDKALISSPIIQIERPEDSEESPELVQI